MRFCIFVCTTSAAVCFGAFQVCTTSAAVGLLSKVMFLNWGLLCGALPSGQIIDRQHFLNSCLLCGAMLRCALWGISRNVLGAHGRIFVIFWRHLGVTWRLLGASCRPSEFQVSIWEHSGIILGCQGGVATRSGGMLETSTFLNVFLVNE